MKLSIPKKIVLIGASTGGPGQIQKIINNLPKLKSTSIIIAQHMADGFIESFASRLQNSNINEVSVIKNSTPLESGKIYICEADVKLEINSLTFTKEKSAINTFNPSIDTIFNSFAGLHKGFEIMSIILTGIGNDGVKSCINLQKHGAVCITESQDSAIIDGMPKSARESVPDIKAYDIQKIVKTVSEFCQ